MGSIATLSINNLEIDWSKNYNRDHSNLFSDTDEKKLSSFKPALKEEIDPDHFIYVRKVKNIKTRLSLLGYRKENLENILDDIKSEESLISDDVLDIITIDFLVKIMNHWDFQENFDSFEFDKYEGETIFSKKCIQTLIEKAEFDIKEDKYTEIAEFLNYLHPYLILSIIVHNQLAEESYIIWDFYYVYINGWIDEDVKIFHQTPLFLIITEGSSDSSILQKALTWIDPDISYFFDFIDMTSNYPFTGVGNIVNFYHGICKLKLERIVIFLFDNDTAGNSALTKCIEPPNNISLLKLPKHIDFYQFTCIGPSGETNEDINNKAVSIECFLDLNYKCIEPPRVRWISYDEKINQYQGSLINKENYSKMFYVAFKKRDRSYSLVKLKYLLDFLVNEASKKGNTQI